MISALKFRSALIALAFVNFCKPAAANPTNPTVVNGTATITNPNASTLQITNSPGAIINWQGFSINAGEITQFLQSSPASAILNRVTGTDPSQILGTLQSNGRVFLINPNGIVFGAGAVVDVQGLIASTLDISNNDFLNGNYNFLQTGTGAPITLQNGAQITTANAGNGGQVWLIARSIEQAGNITTPGGQTILAAGTNVQVASSALGNMVFNITTDGTNDIQSLGSIAANQGVAGLFADNITHSGTINAQSVGGVQGQVVMNADNNLLVQDGGVINANSSDGSNAGKINLTAGNQLEVQRLASVSADGATSGGNGGQINLTAYDLRVSSVANAGQNLHASARNPSGVNGTVTLNQTGNPSFSPEGELIVSDVGNYSPWEKQYSPSITALADGGYVVTWGSKDNGNDDIYAQRYDANGNAVGSEFVVSNAPAGEYSPTITALADGGFVIAWRSMGNMDHSILLQRYDIYAQRYDASGKAIGKAFAISDPTAIHLSSEPAIAALADGGFVTTWDSTTRVGGPPNVTQGVYGRRYDAMGNALGSEFLISNNISPSPLSRPTIATLSDGSFVVTWGSDSGLLARRYNATGNAVGSEFLINEVGLQASLAPLVNGGFVVTWTEGNFTNRYDVYARRYDANGNAVENKFLISLGGFNNGTATLDRVNPAISSLADGGFIVTWENFLYSGLYFDVIGFVNLYAQRYDASGNKVGSEFLVSNKGTRSITSIITSTNGIAALDHGGFVATWVSNNSRDYYSALRRYDKVPAPFTQDDNQVTGELGIVAGFNSRPGLSNSVLTPPPSDSTVIPTVPSKVEQELALSNAVCATFSPSASRESLPEGEEAFRLLSTNATGLNCPGQSNSQMHSDAIGKGWNNSTQAPPQEQAYAQMVGEHEYTLTRAMSWKARQAYWNEHSQKQSTLSAEEYANYLNQVRSLSESERAQRYEQLGQQQTSN